MTVTIQLIRRRRGTSSGPPAFSPADLTGLRLWLDASTLGLAEGARVSSFTDRSGAGRHAVQSTPALQPHYRAGVQGGLGVVSFENVASGEHLTYATNPMTGATAGTVFSLEKGDNDPGAGSAKAFLEHWGNPQDDHVPYIEGSIYQGWGSLGRQIAGNPPASLAAFRVHTITARANQWRYYLDGGAPFFTSPDCTIAWNAPATLAAPGGGWAGDSAELICYDRVLPPAELNQVGGYLAAKWAVPWSPVS